MSIRIDPAVPADVPVILQLIRELAEFERLLNEVTATEAQLQEQLFGPQPRAEVVIARLDDEVAGFALFFHNFSTFLGKPGLYLEDLYVRQKFRGGGCGAASPAAPAQASRSSAAVVDSSGRCSTGISARSISTSSSVPCP